MRPSLLRLTAAAGATAAVLAVSPSAFAADAVYGGIAGSDDPIVVKADAKATKLRSIAISWRAMCGDGMGFPSATELTPVVPTPGFSPGSTELLVSRNAKGRFKGTRLGGGTSGSAVFSIVVDVEGKLTRTRATGSIAAVVKIMDGATGAGITSCDTGKLRWRATRQPRIIYGGTTAQDQPVVVRLNGRRNRVNDLITAWDAHCTPSESFVRLPEHFGNFPVKSTGSFGNPFAQDYALDDGSKRRFEYAVTGRVSRTRVKGTLQVKVSDTDAGGVAIDTCDTGGVSWSAVTG